MLGALLVRGEQAALAQGQPRPKGKAGSQPPAPSASSATAQPARRVSLLVLESSPEFSSRVRGQVSDLELTLEVEAVGPLATRAEVSPYDFAEAYMALGESAKALDYLRRSCELHIPEMIGVRADPFFEALRGSPEFEGILHTVGLTPAL